MSPNLQRFGWRLELLWKNIFKKLTMLVSIVTYLMLVFGVFRAIYYSYYRLNYEQLILTVAMTIFAIYVNLKNPNV